MRKGIVHRFHHAKGVKREMYAELLAEVLAGRMREYSRSGVSCLTTPFLDADGDCIEVYIEAGGVLYTVSSDPLFARGWQNIPHVRSVLLESANRFGCAVGPDDTVVRACRPEGIGEAIFVVAQCIAAADIAIRSSM